MSPYTSGLPHDFLSRLMDYYPEPTLVQVVGNSRVSGFAGRLVPCGFYERRHVSYLVDATREEVKGLVENPEESGLQVRRINWEMDGGRVSLKFLV